MLYQLMTAAFLVLSIMRAHAVDGTLLEDLARGGVYDLAVGHPLNTARCDRTLQPVATSTYQGARHLSFLNTTDLSDIHFIRINAKIVGRGEVVTKVGAATTSPLDAELGGYVKETTESSAEMIEARGKTLKKVKLSGAYLLVGVLYRDLRRTVENSQFDIRIVREGDGILLDYRLKDRVRKIDTRARCVYRPRD